MARVVILGAGIAGHTAALHLRRMLGKQHDVVVVTPNSKWNWIPSNIWVGVGKMTADKVVFPLEPIYRRKGIEFHQALATTIFPEGTADDERTAGRGAFDPPGVRGADRAARLRLPDQRHRPEAQLRRDPGPRAPTGNSLSVCTASHASHTAGVFDSLVEELKKGEKKTIVIGTGHGTCTCEGAAFEYTFNVEHELRERGVRDNAEVIYLTNEYELGDFGVGGMSFTQMGFTTSSQTWTESLFRERGVKAITRAHVQKVEPGVVHYEQLDGSEHTQEFDFAMLLPPFRGADLTAVDKNGEDITSTLFAPNGLTKVDADYTPKPYEEWTAEDWPTTYRNPTYPNIFAPGIAFAPPHPISVPRKSPNGTVITPCAAAHGHAVGDHGEDRRSDDQGPDRERRRLAPHAASMAPDGRRVRGLGRHRPAPRVGGRDDDVPGGPGLAEVSGDRSRREGHLRRDRPGRSLDQGDAALPLPVQGQGSAVVVPHPRVSR